MTKEEIREGFDKLVRENAKSETLWYYLHVNGVVLKAERELPLQVDGLYQCEGCGSKYMGPYGAKMTRVGLKKAGYVAVESLV